MTEIEQQVGVWLNSKPGPFWSRDRNTCLRDAYESFLRGSTERCLYIEFQPLLAVHGVDVRANPFGGYHLDWS